MKIYYYIVCLAILTGLNSCFTGVENTPKITEKDVKKTISELERKQPSMTLVINQESANEWKSGKQFYVTDNQVKNLFSHSQYYDSDTISLAGKLLTYVGLDTVVEVDNRIVTILKFTAGDTIYSYKSGKTIDELSLLSGIPLLIDMDMVNQVARELEGKEVYIKTSIWYDLKKEYMIKGRQFIKVRITKVSPGNKVLPLKIIFKAVDNSEEGFVWMSMSNSMINNRDYDSLFSVRDIHLNYPDISDEHWEKIVVGEVVEDMTKEECRLAKGAPKSITRAPDQSMVREYWYYDGGMYLLFVDGLLKSYRK